MTLNVGATLEIVMEEGDYALGNSYTLLRSGAAITNNTDTINLVVPAGSDLVGEFQENNTVYALVVAVNRASSFAELQAALTAHKPQINILMENIDFNGELTIDYGNVIINGLSGETKSTFSGRENNRHFRVNQSSDEILLKNINFTAGRSIDSDGGAISLGNETAITFENSSFSDNISAANGGAIYSGGASSSRNTLTFSGETIFSGNESTSGSGGAIYTYYSDLNFNEEAIFEDNKTSGKGAAIFVSDSTVIFNNGLQLLTNDTDAEAGGAIDMLGTDENNRSIVTIVQNDAEKQTEIRGNTSNNGSGHNAVYLEEYAELNFNLVNGDAVIYDAINGDRTKDGNDVNLEGSGGWLRLIEENASLDNVNLSNGGQLDISEMGAKEINPINFTNSGRIKFKIFPENGVNTAIAADNITLLDGTVLEIIMAEGDYTIGNSYVLLRSGAAMAHGTEIHLIVPEGLGLVRSRVPIARDAETAPATSENSDLEGEFQEGDTVYALVIRGKSENTEEDEVEENIPVEPEDTFSDIPGLTENQKSIAEVLDIICRGTDSPTTAKIKKLTPEEKKLFLEQLPGDFYANVFGTRARFIGDTIPREIAASDNYTHKILLSMATGDLESAEGTRDTRTSFFLRNDNYIAGGKIFIGVSLLGENHRILSKNNSSVSAAIKSLGFGIRGGLVGDVFDARIALALNKDSYSVARGIEMLGVVANSQFTGSSYSITGEMAMRHTIGKFLVMRYFLGTQITTVSHGDIEETGAEELNLVISASKHTLNTMNFGVDASSLFSSKINLHINLEGAYTLSPSLGSSASFRDRRDSEFNSNYEHSNLLLGSKIGINYNPLQKLTLSLDGGYQKSLDGSLTLMNFSFGIKFGF
jgi:predicted outer membrane repeat protein